MGGRQGLAHQHQPRRRHVDVREEEDSRETGEGRRARRDQALYPQGQRGKGRSPQVAEIPLGKEAICGHKTLHESGGGKEEVRGGFDRVDYVDAASPKEPVTIAKCTARAAQWLVNRAAAAAVIDRAMSC